MEMRWTIETLSDHVVIRVEGQFHTASIRKLIDETANICTATGSTRVLLDLRSMQGPLSEEDRYLGGVRIAERLKGTRVAVVGPAGSVTQFGMKVANRRGAQMLATTDIEEAQRWLLGA